MVDRVCGVLGPEFDLDGRGVEPRGGVEGVQQLDFDLARQWSELAFVLGGVDVEALESHLLLRRKAVGTLVEVDAEERETRGTFRGVEDAGLAGRVAGLANFREVRVLAHWTGRHAEWGIHEQPRGTS